ncbi:MAG: efflux RND transporter periplasmic adaptor subunit [Lachnospiraceae bacterium]|jgi:RND family efflux transporter MFP subunit|nr:efflux RND transporter periplasmic adaptor subunit [Lachnospiraceae bacterium]
MKKVLTAIIVLIVLVAIGFGVWYVVAGQNTLAEKEETRPTVATVKPQTADIVNYTSLVGTVEPATTVTVIPKMAGEMTEVSFAVGEEVKEGQTLVRLHSDALSSLQIQVDAAKISMDDAASTLAKMEALYAAGGVSQQTIDQLQSAATATRLQYEAAKTQLDLQEEYTDIVSPIDGVVESRSAEVHGMASPGVPVAVISARGETLVTFGVTERVLGNLGVGMEIDLTKEQTLYRGVIREVGNMVNPMTGLFQVKAAVVGKVVGQGAANSSEVVDIEYGTLATGTKIKVTAVVEQVQGALTVPLDAVLYSDGQPFVYVLEQDPSDSSAVASVRKVDIVQGIHDSSVTQVVSGLGKTDEVVVTWSNELTDGAGVIWRGNRDSAGGGAN